MIPFVRTPTEARRVVELLEENGLKRGENGLRLIMMCEIPSNALMADQFLEYFDGFSIGSNDLTQLTLGLDRDSSLVAESFDERDPAVKALLSQPSESCRKARKYVGICGQGPSDHPDLALWLMKEGIGSLSLNPDSVVETWLYLAEEVKKKDPAENQGTDFKTIDLRICSCNAASAPPAPTVKGLVCVVARTTRSSPAGFLLDLHTCFYVLIR